MESQVKNNYPWRLLDIPHIRDESGELCIVERSNFFPFEFERFIYVHDVPETAKRAEHAHKVIDEVVIALAGGFDVLVDNGDITEKIKMESPNTGLYIPRMVWISLESFKQGTVYLVVTSGGYNEREHIRDYQEFLSIVHSTKE
jgi:mannose-6-phosphate isomerase-like protein (cupin superfamily)